ncbi:MAG: hypothetical protein IJ124_08660 [Clostridia bacterium]|nr:hypothetical protein [Clostridia bacterium]
MEKVFQETPGARRGLLLFGGTGRGARRMAARIARRLSGRGVRALWIDAAGLGGLDAEALGRARRDMKRARVLVLDATGAMGDDAIKRTYDAVCWRGRYRREMIVCLNAQGARLSDVRWRRLLARLSEACRAVFVEDLATEGEEGGRKREGKGLSHADLEV